jgi:nitroreductase
MGPLVAAASGWASIIPAGWSFLLALRSRGLGSVWTTLHLSDEKAVAELLGIADHVTQAALFPVVYTIGTALKPPKRPPPETVMSGTPGTVSRSRPAAPSAESGALWKP